MTKTLTIIAVIICAGFNSMKLNAQNKSIPNRLLHYIPHGWKLKESLTLDLNSDSVKDFVMVIESSQPEKYKDDAIYANKYYHPKELIILFGQGGGKYKLILKTSKIFGDYKGGIQFMEPYYGLSKSKHDFIVHFISGGSSGRQSYDYVFRYLKNEFYLVRLKCSEYELPIDNNSYDNDDVDYLKNTDEIYDIADGKKKNYRRIAMKKSPLIKLRNFEFILK